MWKKTDLHCLCNIVTLAIILYLPRKTRGATLTPECGLFKEAQRKGIKSCFKVRKEVESLDPDKLITLQWVNKAGKTAEQATGKRPWAGGTVGWRDAKKERGRHSRSRDLNMVTRF